MKLVIRPRLQVETWSLYWKEPMRTDTQWLADVTITTEDDAPLQQVLQQVADKMGWPPVDKLLRLEGFTGGWSQVPVSGISGIQHRAAQCKASASAYGCAKSSVVD